MPDAKDWIGASAKGDSLDDTKILAAISPAAQELRQILASPRVVGLIRSRRENSTAAAKAQRDFWRLTMIVIVSTAIATLSSGLLLYGAGSDAATATQVAAQSPAAPPQQGLADWVTHYRRLLSVIQLLSLLASGFATSALASLKPVERWAVHRNKAEVGRRDVFDEVLRQAKQMLPATNPAAAGCDALSQALEFFRRFQVELQRDYYARNTVRHEEWARTLTWLTAGLAGLAAITGTLAGFGGSALIASAFLGIAVPILLSAAQSWRVMSRDTDKAGAFAKAKTELDVLMGELGEVRRDALTGNVAAVEKFVADVHVVMATENNSWIPAGV